MMDGLFYKLIASNPLLEASPLPEDYSFYAKDDVFAGFIRKDFDVRKHYREGDGWKIHLTIHPGDLVRAFDNVIAPILLDAKVGAVKFTHSYSELSAISRPDKEQSGKMVTIYGAGRETWASLAKKIEMGLAKEGIRPGPPKIYGDRMVKGSRYIGYRNERAFELEDIYKDGNPYIAIADVMNLVESGHVEKGWEYNPTKKPDTMKDIDFSKDQEILEAQESADNKQPNTRITSVELTNKIDNLNGKEATR
jgi:hypothetical protein